MQDINKCSTCNIGRLVCTGEPPREMVLGKMLYRHYCKSCGADHWLKDKLEVSSGDNLPLITYLLKRFTLITQKNALINHLQ